MELRRLDSSEIALIGQIDRSEHVDNAYRIEDGELVRHPVAWDVLNWHATGTGEHSLRHQIDHWRPVVEDGGILIGAFDGRELLGLVIVVPEYDPGLTWLAFLHISRPHRGRGVGKALWAESERIARVSDAAAIYVSAIPSGPTIDFYRGRGCQLADEPHPHLFAKEPEDIHLICRLNR